MIIKKVSFDCTIAMPGYSNVKPGIVEADLEPGETIEQAWTELNQRAIAWHKKEYPHLYQEGNDSSQHPGVNYVSAQISTTIPTISKDTERLEIAIDNAQSVEELKMVKGESHILPTSIVEHYNKRMNELLAESK